MIVQKSRLLLDGDEARIVSSVRSESEHFAPFELVIRVPRAFVGWLEPDGQIPPSCRRFCCSPGSCKSD